MASNSLQLITAMHDVLIAAGRHARRHCAHVELRDGCDVCDWRRLVMSIEDEYDDWREAALPQLARMDDALRTFVDRDASGACLECDDIASTAVEVASGYTSWASRYPWRQPSGER